MLIKTATIDHYSFGIITALPKEFAAVTAVLAHTSNVTVPGDTTIYTTGKIGPHGVVLALLPKMGLEPAAVISSHLLRSFPDVSDILMVGIAGGAPDQTNAEAHVRLGDIVVSVDSGVFQFDLGKRERVARENGATEERFVIRASDPSPSARLQQAVRLLEVRRLLGQSPWEEDLKRVMALTRTGRPLEATDVLFDSHDSDNQISHPFDGKRVPDQPKIHYGRIASSNTLLKDPIQRDFLRDNYGVRAFEMEGAGVAAATWTRSAGYLLIRGICDYCDTHKNDTWQAYAAAAAAFAGCLIGLIPVNGERTVSGTVSPEKERVLRGVLIKYFTSEELENLCAEVELNMQGDQLTVQLNLDIVGGNGLEDQALKLVTYLKRRGYLHYLIHAVCQARPNIESINKLID